MEAMQLVTLDPTISSPVHHCQWPRHWDVALVAVAGPSPAHTNRFMNHPCMGWKLLQHQHSANQPDLTALEHNVTDKAAGTAILAVVGSVAVLLVAEQSGLPASWGGLSALTQDLAHGQRLLG